MKPQECIWHAAECWILGGESTEKYPKSIPVNKCKKASESWPSYIPFILNKILVARAGVQPATLRVRSALLYATELPGHVWVVYRGEFDPLR